MALILLRAWGSTENEAVGLPDASGVRGRTECATAGHAADRSASSRWMRVCLYISLREQKSLEQSVQLLLCYPFELFVMEVLL